MQLLMGNLVALVGSLLLMCVGFCKDRKKILCFQTAQIGMFVLSNIILGGYTGAIVNAISIFRNILCYKDKLGLKEKVIITILVVFPSLIFNNLGAIGLLPIVSTLVYLWFMDVKDVVKFKALIMVTLVLWLTYDICIKSYTSALFDFISFIGCIIAIIQIKGKKKINSIG